MATALTAQGIGFSGAPREYTGIIMQRNRQKQLDEQAAKQKKDKEYADLYDKISIKDPSQFFTFDLNDVQRTSAETIDRLAKARADGNFREEAKIKNEYFLKIGSLQQQKKDYDANIKSNRDDIYDRELLDFENSPSREEAIKKYGGREGIVVQGDQLRFKPTRNYNQNEEFTKIANDKNVIMQDGFETVTDNLGNSFRREKYKINPVAYDARLASRISDPLIFDSELAKYKIQNPKWRELSALDLQQEVVNKFMNDGRSFAGIPNTKQSKIGKGINITISNNNGNGDDSTNPTQRAGDITMNIKTTDLNGQLVTADYTLKEAIQTGNLNATAIVPNTAINMQNNEKFNSLGSVPYVANTTGVGLFVKRDIVIGGKEFKAGQLVADEWVKNFPNEISKDRVEYKPTTFAVATVDGEEIPVAFEAKLPNQDMYLKSDNKDKPIVKNLMDLSTKVKELNQSLPNSATNSREVKPQPKPVQQKAAEKPKDKSQMIPSSGTRPKRLVWDNKQKKMVEAK